MKEPIIDFNRAVMSPKKREPKPGNLLDWTLIEIIEMAKQPDAGGEYVVSQSLCQPIPRKNNPTSTLKLYTIKAKLRFGSSDIDYFMSLNEDLEPIGK